MLVWIWFRLCLGIYSAVAATKKNCPEETTNEKNPVIWPISPSSKYNVASSPMCLSENQELITRRCSNSTWTPKHNDVPNCHTTQSQPTPDPCPPDYYPIMDSDKKLLFCYTQNDPQIWNFPCLSSGSSKTIFDLKKEELELLKSKLIFEDKKLIWIPAKRIVPFGEITWTLLGKWGKTVEFNDKIIYTRLPVIQSCLLLDLDKFTVKTDNCSYQYPSICIFKGDHLLQLHCPLGYQASRYAFNSGRCYGLEFNKMPISWNDFYKNHCKQPLQILDSIDNYLIQEASKAYYKKKNRCWTALSKNNEGYVWYPNITVSYLNWGSQTNFSVSESAKGIIDDKFKWLLLEEENNLTCMACKIIPEKKEVEMTLHYSFESDKLSLIVYNPRSLWKKDVNKVGVQCFTNANGFVRTAEIDDSPSKETKFALKSLIRQSNEKTINNNDVEKSTYDVEIINDSSGEYWCEGHSSISFDLIKTSKVLVFAKTTDYHAFVLKMEVKGICKDLSTCNPYWEVEAERIKYMLKAEEVRIMEVESMSAEGNAVIIFHVDVDLDDYVRCYGPVNCKIVTAFYFLENICKNVFANVDEYNFLSLASTMFCMPVNNLKFSLHWEITPIGDITAPKEFCMQSNGLPVTRQCGGSFMYGGRWMEVLGECSRDYEATNRTTFLYNIAKGHTNIETTSTFLTHDMILILDDKADMIPADVYFLSLSLKTIVELSDQNSSLIELGDSINIATAIDSIMNIEEPCLNMAQTMNSSNVLLESLDMILAKIAQNESDTLLNHEKGIDVAVTPQYILQISNPSVNNVTGLALLRRDNTNSTSFLDMEVVQLTSNTTVNDVLALEGLEIATWLPEDLMDMFAFINHLDNNTMSNIMLPNIIIDIFYSDIVFQETKPDKDRVNSRVVSITLPGYESELPLPVPIVYRRLDKSKNSDRQCVYWDFQSHHHGSMGGWSKKGCYFVASYGELDVCACFHLTNFAQLILGFSNNGNETPGDIIIHHYHGRALNAITLVGCSLSLLGVAGIGVTAVLFRSWRKKPGTKVLLQLSAAIALQSVMMVSQDGLYESDVHCMILGGLLHYSVLAAFMWMLMTALLQFARYVKVLGAQRPARFMVKFSLIGWGVPVLPILILILVDNQAYLPNSSQESTALCYPQGYGLYFSVLLPVGCIVLTNLIVFVLVMRSVLIGPDGKRRGKDPEIVASQLRLSILLFFLLGLTWIFGLLAVTGGRIIFSYLFCLTATMQGFVLFVYFVICDPATRVLWVSLVREKSTSSRDPMSSSNISNQTSIRN